MDLVKWDKLKSEIAKATDPKDLTKLKVEAAAVAEWARVSGLKKEIQDDIGESRIRIDRARGKWIKANVPEGGAKGIGPIVTKISHNLKEAGIGRNEGAKLRALADVPEPILEEFFSKTKSSKQDLNPKLSFSFAAKLKKERERQNIIDAGKEIESLLVELGDITTYETEKKFDFIITDPPYPREYLDLFGTLAIRSKEWLKPTGLLVVMSGQSYLDQIYQMLSEHLTYYWTACYLTPGQPTPLRTRQVNTTWKPILIYAMSEDYKGKIFGDVFKSDGNDKSFHKWGQSESGMYSLVSQICLPGQSIFDPFCGAGTTGVAAIKHGCSFHGIDVSKESIAISKKRLSETEKVDQETK